MALQEATLEVVVPPQISDKYSTKDISVSEGGQAKFICSASGHPTPSITWQRVAADKQPMSSENSSDYKKGKVACVLLAMAQFISLQINLW